MRRLPVGVFLEQGVEGLIQAVLVAAKSRHRRRPRLLADQVDDLVAQDAEHPGLQRRAASEILAAGQRGGQGVLDGVFGERGVAQLELGEGQHVVADLFDKGVVDAGWGNDGGLRGAGVNAAMVAQRAASSAARSLAGSVSPARRATSLSPLKTINVDCMRTPNWRRSSRALS